MTLSRRTFLVASSGLVVVASVGLYFSRSRQDALLAPSLAEPPTTPSAGMLVLGAAFLKQYPANKNEARLREMCGLSAGQKALDIILKPTAARNAYEARVRADYFGGRTVVVERWILSESECGLAGLVALASS